MKLGTVIQFSDGRNATVVYNGLDGVGVRMGEHTITEEDLDSFRGSSGGLFSDEHLQQDFRDRYSPEFLLRPESDSKFTGTPCIGMDFDVIREGYAL